MTSNELTRCFHPNDISYVCKEEIPIHTYIPETDCESTLLHPSTIKIPYHCEYRFLKLKHTLWIPLHLSNEWLYVAPESETLTVLCPEETTTLKIQTKGKLTLNAGCKGYTSYVTLYSMSAITTNLTTDYVPSAPVDFDCCFEDVERVNFEKLPMQVPLANVLSNTDDLRVASMKADEIEQMIKDQEIKQSQHLYLMATSWGTTLLTIFVVITCICCSCCFCKCCRNGFFWFWNRWSPSDCWKETQDKCCVSIYNYNGSRVEYAKTNTSPAVSIRSLPELESPISNQPKRELNEQTNLKEEIDCISKRTRSKQTFR
jgi:hypothetical protein